LRINSYSRLAILLEAGYPKPPLPALTGTSSSPPVGTKFQFRAECDLDANGWKKVAGTKVNNVTITTATLEMEGKKMPISDVEVTFYSTLALDELRDTFRQVEDGHVMLESVNTADKYDGERYYED